jgi:hypothetical protein
VREGVCLRFGDMPVGLGMWGGFASGLLYSVGRGFVVCVLWR